MVDPNISVCFPSLTLLYYHHRHFGVCLGLSFIFCLHSVGTGFFSLAFPSSSHWDPGNDRTAICEVKSFPVQMVNTIYDELDCLLAHDIPLFCTTLWSILRSGCYCPWTNSFFRLTFIRTSAVDSIVFVAMTWPYNRNRIIIVKQRYFLILLALVYHPYSLVARSSKLQCGE